MIYHIFSWPGSFLLFWALILVFKANSEDPDQTPHFAAFDQGLHCLPRSILYRMQGIMEYTLEYCKVLRTLNYSKIPKNSDTRNFAVITLKVEHDGFT